MLAMTASGKVPSVHLRERKDDTSDYLIISN